jgi:N-acetylmuramoyl-L-alanine amidase
MNWKNLKFPLKQVIIGGLLMGTVLTLTSTNYDKSSKENIHSELTNENIKRLANTHWKLKYYDCSNCSGRADDLTLQEGGVGTLEGSPVKWSVKDDSVNIITDPKLNCKFPRILLADESLMFGINICDGDKRAASFIASKINPNLATAAAAAAMPNPMVESKSISIFDKTYMFKRGFERVYGERKIDALIIHSSFCVNSLNPFDLYCVLAEYKRHGVAAHYLIDREGSIHRLVNEDNIAFHAGFGKMPDGYNAINTRSMGIEIINSESEGPNDVQYAALARLVKDIKSRHRIKYIKGHNQIAPGRKSDPWKFNWKNFYDSIKEETMP